MALALCLCIGMFAGCGNTAASAEEKTSSAAPAQEETQAPEEAPAAPETESDRAVEASAAEEAPAVGEGEITQHAKDVFGVEEAPAENSYPLDTDESLTLVATFPDPLFASYPGGMADCQIYQVAEEKTGVHMEYQPLSTSASAEQFNVMIASGSYPDLIDLIDYIAEYAPNYFNILATDDELLDTAITDGGHIVGFHAVRTEQTLGKAGLAIRTDELQKLGLDKPYTIEEFENTLAAFKDDGLKQPLVMLAPGAIQDNWLAAAFNVSAFCNSFPMSVAPTYVEDGEIKFGPLEKGFKEYITLIHDWYEKGYIHSDFVSLNSNWNSPDYANAITSGDAGIFYADQGNLGGYIAASEIPGFAVEATYDMHATKDSINHFAQYTKKSVGNGFKITTNCENIELACKWGDWWYSEEGSLLANYGVEGVSFDYIDGKPVLNETVTDAPEGMRDALLIYASNDTICCVIDPNAVTSGYSEVDKAAPEIWNEGMDDSMVIPSTVTLSADENTRAANIYSDIETICLEAIAKFITGEKPLTDYDSFVESIRSAGIDDYLAIQQGAYDRAMEG